MEVALAFELPRVTKVAQAWANTQTVLTYISHSHPELEHMQAVYATSKYV